MTDGVAQHRLGHHDRVDVVVGALDPELQFLSSHRTAAIEHSRLSLESQGPVVRMYFPETARSHPLTAAPRGCAESKRAKTTIRFAAL